LVCYFILLGQSLHENTDWNNLNNNKYSLDNNKNNVNIIRLLFIFLNPYNNLNLVGSGRCSNFNLGLFYK